MKPSSHQSPPPRPAPRRRRRAFAFTEILFAVMILGLGFIMIAAMFPVTIGQTQATVQETAAAGAARAAFEALARCPNLGQLEPTDTGNKPLAECPLLPIAEGAPSPTKTQDVWRALAGNFINSQDPRYAWSVLYRRANNESVAQVIIIVTQNRTRGEYNFEKDVRRRTSEPAVLEHKPILITQIDRRDDGTEIRIKKANDTDPVEGIVADGAYVVLADVASALPATMNGRVFQLGPRVNYDTGTNTPLVYRIQPGTELSSSESDMPNVAAGVGAFIVGRSYREDYTGATAAEPPDFEGAAQDIGVYTGFISIP